MSNVGNGSKTIRQSDTPKVVEVKEPFIGRKGVKGNSSKAKKVVNCEEANVLANSVCSSQYRSELYEKIKECNMVETFKDKLMVCGLHRLSYSDAAKELSYQLHVKLSGKELEKMLRFYPELGLCFSFTKAEYVLKSFRKAQEKVQTTEDALKIIEKTGDAGLGLLKSNSECKSNEEETELSETNLTIDSIKRELSVVKLDSLEIEPDEDIGGEDDV